MKAGSWTFTATGLRVWVRCDQGARRRIEDAWFVDTEGFLGPRKLAVFAVFDGLGGEPKGDVAARTASTELPVVVRRSSSIHEILPRLNDAVLASGGYTTAVVATLNATGEVEIAHVGDSGAFSLVNGGVRLLTERDAAPSGSITDFLGNPRLRGHVARTSLSRGSSLLLCTDGIDGIVGMASLAELLRSSDDEVPAAIDTLYKEIHSLGAPDNATMVLVRRD